MTTFLTRMVVVAACLLVMPIGFYAETASAQSSLKKCPESQNVRWHNCYGKWSDGKGYTYEGEWQDDKQSGLGTQTFSTGEKYVGEFKDNKRNGQFVATYSDGSKYVGEFKDDKFNGRGIFTSADGSKYVGEFKDDLFTGQGTYTHGEGQHKGEVYVGEFENDKFNGHGTYTFPNGDKHIGEYADNAPSGQGTLTFVSGDKYVGEFKGWAKSGQGTFNFASGDKYVGEFKDDKLNGQGTYTYKDGRVDFGEFRDGVLNGPGSSTFPDGNKYVGEFKDDKRNGQGTFTFADGSKYVGEFKDDLFTGQGTFTFADGSKYVGEFKDNKFNSQFAVSYVNGDSFSGGYQSDKRDGKGTYNWKDGSRYVGQWKDGLPTSDGILTNASESVIIAAQYKSAAVYDNDGGMTSPDVLTYSGGAVQQQAVPQTPEPQQQSITTNDSLRKVALVIGNGAYENAPQLANPKNDAKAMSEMLSSLGFKVITAVDAKKPDMESSIRDFLRDARSADLSLLFYSGHGIEVGGENFLLPIDAKLEEEAALNFEVINSKVITNIMGGDKQTGIILLDACRDNPFTKSLKRSMIASRAATVSDGLAPISSDGGGLVVAFATAPGDTASDGEGANSPFTTALLKWMPERGLEIELMMKKVKSEVSTITNNDQRPWTNSDLTTEVYLAGQ